MSAARFSRLGSRAAALAVLLLLGVTAALSAQTYPSLERGVKAEKLFQFGDLDSVNLMNGNLVMRIPIGAPYPVGGSLSYGLALIYNSKAWDFQEAYYQGQPYGQALPDRLSNAGMGWSLSLGRLLDPNDPANDHDTGRWVYIGPDGSEHLFYQGLQTVGPVAVDPCTGTCYSRDGSYIRMSPVSATQKVVETSDGTRHYFQRFTLPDATTEWRLTEMRDRFEDGLTDVALTYTADGNTWTITDKHGRQQKVFFGADPAGRYRRVLTRIELTAFGAATPPAVYSFSYLPPQTISVPCGSTLPFWTSVSVPMLSSVFLPDGTSYGMVYNTPSSPDTCHAPGLLSYLVLPTRGKLHYTYRQHTVPVKGCSYRSWHSSTAGVATRQFVDAAGGDLGTWTYSTALSNSPWPTTAYVCDDGRTPFRPPSEELQVTVTTPLKDRTLFYFSVFPGTEFPSTSSFDERDYGLPFTRFQTDATGTRFLSTQIQDCDAAGANCSVARSTYVRYERDADSRCDFTTGPGPDCLNTNARLASQRTVYDDDGGRFADVNNSDFDNFGHYRTVASDGNFQSGNQRSTYTNYNPGNVLPGSAWVLGTYTEQTVTEGAASAKVQSCFDPATGFLSRQRTYSTGTSPSGNDLLLIRTPDNAGNAVRQEWYGGDAASQSLSLATDLCNLSLPASNAYRLDQTFQYGVLQTAQYKDAAGNATGTLAYKTVDQDIDARTGLVSVSRDTAGIGTNLSYDAMGRLVTVKPQTSGVAWEQFNYVNATSGNRARVEDLRCSPANLTTCTALTQAQTELDDLGRVAKERRLMANGTWSKRVTTYDLAGNQATVSELQPDTTADASLTRTTFSGYDPFSRPATVTPADGAAHAVTYLYAGVRTRTRTAKVGTGVLDAGGNIPETAVSRTEVYDRQGRLWRVNEPSNPTGAAVTTEYTYDVGGRVGVVKTTAPEGTQFRYFSYDNRGFLKSDTQPEKGGLQAKASGYDPLGHVGRTEDVVGGPNDLTYLYDRAGRLIQVRETGATGRTLKDFVYAGANGTGNFKLGKLELDRRYNHVLFGTTPYTVEVSQTYVYGGLEGRVSKRDTQLVTNGTPGESFTQSFSWDSLGNPATLGSSRCTHTGCTGAPAVERTTSYGYANGFLTGVTGYASSISYHPNGMVNQVAHANGVTDTQAADSTNWLARPLSISTSGASANWSTGTYKYDGSGNVIKMGTDWFRYDGVNRLLRGAVHDGLTGGGNEKQQAYTYDTYGNINQIATTAGGTTQTRLTPTSWSNNRLTGTATYDGAGNLTGWNGATYQYDRFNRIWRMVNGAEEWLYFYNADDERFWCFKVNGNFSRFTLRDLGGKVLREYNTGAAWTVESDYVYRAGLLLAAETSAGQRHFHLDHLGTPRLVTNAAAQQAAYHVYYPFGEEATAFNQDTQRMKFTGHERDLASLAGPGDDLDYMHARYFSPVSGRFLSVDPSLDWDLAEPQSWNLYSYVRNNPVGRTDSTGRYVETPIDLVVLGIDVGIGMYETYKTGKTSEVTKAAIAADLITLSLPGAAGGGLVVRGGALALHSAEGLKFAARAVQAVTKINQAAQMSRNAGSGGGGGASGSSPDPLKTIIEDKTAMKKADGLKGQAKAGYEKIKNLLARGEAGGNQHALTGDLAGKYAIDLPGGGAGRGAQRVIYSIDEGSVTIHDIIDYHVR